MITYRTIGGCEIEAPGPCSLIIFGASGDLAKRKLIPALYRLHKNRILPEDFFILGLSRSEMDDAAFRELMLIAVKNAFPDDFDTALWTAFAARLYYSTFDPAISKIKPFFKERLAKLEEQHRTHGNRIFYLAIPPSTYEDIIHSIGTSGICREDTGYAHIVIEKPFGRDIDSAKKLNGILNKYFEERQIFRIDHYLAKETVQNVLMFRFANSIFEPIWNRKYIDHIQITASESLGIEKRSGYYEEAGVIRDMFQNHMLQLAALVAMEPPATFNAEGVREEKIKVFRSIKPFPLDRLSEYIAIGQYGKGEIDGKPAIGYREEQGVSPNSILPTFAAMKIFIDNWRWNGVPFYLRSGKRLSKKITEIAIQFKPVPHMMFKQIMGEPIAPNAIFLRIQPDECICLTFQTKLPGSKYCLNPVSMEFLYQRGIFLDAYERALIDCMLGDQMLFWSQAGVELTWSLLTPVIERLESTAKQGQFPNYIAGSSGPKEAILLMERDGRAWRPL